MSHNPLTLKEGAIFISDAHYSFKHHRFLAFLKALRSQKIQTPQLVLMGDIFDLLFGGVAETTKRNKEAIELINTLSDNIEILYLEGNHDFNLASIFPGVTVFSLAEQPVECHYKEQKIAIAHGDFNGPFFYRLYTAVIRNVAVLKLLNLLNKVGKNFIIAWLDRRLKRKDECRKIEDFESSRQARISTEYLKDYKMFIEGHFHQNSSFEVGDCRYINLPAFACEASYMRLSVAGLEAEHFVEEEV